jgi:hypothetical protein
LCEKLQNKNLRISFSALRNAGRNARYTIYAKVHDNNITVNEDINEIIFLKILFAKGFRVISSLFG